METTLAAVEPTRRLQFGWVPEIYFHPRRLFSRMAGSNSGMWLTPILILSITALLLVGANGWIRQFTGGTAVEIPQEFQYYTPEQQAQFQQALSATQGPVFLYVFPGLVSLTRVWLGWLLVGGLIHLITTMLGGRGTTLTTMNIVAWSGMPFAVRDVVRLLAILITRSTIGAPGLAGFSPAGESNASLFLTNLLGLVDIYLIWTLILIILGVHISNGISVAKAAAGVLITIILALALQALVGTLTGKLGSLTIVRPFF